MRSLRSALAAALLGALLLALVYQIPVTHQVDLGGYDAAYTLAFHDPERIDLPGVRPYLDGSDGSARWTRAESFLLFPQAGLPATLTIHLRGNPALAQTALTILVNGAEAERLSVGPDWREVTVPIRGGLTKPEDVLIAIRADPAALSANDPRRAGVLIDRAMLSVGPAPILPYPLQVMYAAVASGLLSLLISLRRAGEGADSAATPGRSALIALALPPLIALAFLLLYRLQPPYPLPLRGLLPGLCLLLAAALAVERARWLAELRWLPRALALGGIAVWLALILLQAGGHLVLSVPGVEKDFRVFATRDTPALIFAADGFYNLGYPLLLWLARPLAADNAFLAGRLLAALSGALLLLATWRLALRALGPGWSLVALAALALSPFVVQYSLYLGSDMPFAAICAWALVALAAATQRAAPAAQPQAQAARSARIAPPLVAGLLAGCAFLIRHPGLALLPLGWLAILIAHTQPSAPTMEAEGSALGARRSALGAWFSATGYRQLALYTLGFALAASPQILVNLRDTGQPLYSQQAKNIWLAVFGDGDWGRWGETSNDIGLAAIALQDPGRLWASFSGNLRAFIGTGAEDTSEFGRAIQLRLLGFPANWLAVVGLLAWAAQIVRRAIPSAPERRCPSSSEGRGVQGIALLWIALYALTVALGFALPRFFLPLAALYALAAGWALAAGARHLGGARTQLALGILLVAWLWGGLGIGAAYVLRPTEAGSPIPGQPEPTLAAARMLLDELRPGERLLVRVPLSDEAGLALAKYSALSDRVAPAPTSDTPEALRASGAALLLWSAELGPAPALGAPIAQFGPYTILRIT